MLHLLRGRQLALNHVTSRNLHQLIIRQPALKLDMHPAAMLLLVLLVQLVSQPLPRRNRILGLTRVRGLIVRNRQCVPHHLLSRHSLSLLIVLLELRPLLLPAIHNDRMRDRLRITLPQLMDRNTISYRDDNEVRDVLIELAFVPENLTSRKINHKRIIHEIVRMQSLFLLVTSNSIFGEISSEVWGISFRA